MDLDSKLYEQVFNTLRELRDTRDHFHTYSATDIKHLIASKLKSVREPRALQKLYKLEAMITELRLLLNAAKEDLKSESS